MTQRLPLSLMLFFSFLVARTQNVFNPNDPIIRFNNTQPFGSAQHPNPALTGLQKWVSTPTSGVSVGTGSIDVSSFKQYFLNFNGTPMAFRVKFPKSYSHPDSASKKYPVMLFLHGAGEVGCPTNGGVYNNEKQLWLGGGLFRDFVDQNLFDGYLVYPQLVNSEGCWGAWGNAPTANFNVVLAMIDSMSKYIRADVDRVIVNGLSGGGYGAWRIADIAPRNIARIIPSAAASTSVNRNNIVHIPVWFATGAKDPDPNTTQADNALNRMKEVGANIRYTRYEDLGHAVWYRHWREPDYAAIMNEAHKANPLVFFQHDAFCAGEVINAKLGISAGYYAYEWQKDGATIATWTNGVTVLAAPQHITSFTGNEITLKSFGTYRVRFKRTSTAEWSVFSPKPVEVKLKTSTITPPISANGAHSTVLPALDGNTSVPLTLPEGFATYEWYRVSDNMLVANTRIFHAPVGTFKARVTEQFGCGTEFSPEFTVVNANGTPKPEAPVSLVATSLSQTTVNLVWTQRANETGFEIYRGTSANGPYKFVALTAANAGAFTDTGLVANTAYFYVLRAVNSTGASDKSNEASAKTLSDKSIPVAPNNLEYRGSTANSVLLKWNAGSDNGGIKRYDIYVNGVKRYSTTSTEFNVINLDSLSLYSFTVKSIDNSENESAPSNQVTAFTHRHGLNYKYYTTSANWYTIPNLKALTPAKSGVMDSVDINDKTINPLTLRFGFLWEGYIYIPVTSTYTFETRSDDGSKLYIDVPYSYTAPALVNNDTIHGMRSRYGTVTLTQGYHSIAIAYFQRTNGLGLELYWRNTSGLAREMIPKHFLAQSGTTIPAAPVTPNGLSASALSYNQITVSWNDNNNSETGYEIVRSTSSGGTYVPIATVAANTTSFVDSGLIWSKPYYYKLRAINEGGESPYSSFVAATTQPAPKFVPAPSPLTAISGPANAVILNWQDNAINEWNYRVYRSVNGTSYNVIFASKGNVNSFTDVKTNPQTVYYYYVLGYNGSGLGPKSNIVKIKAGNNAPVFPEIGDVFAKTNQPVSIDFNLTDDTGDEVEVNILDKPAFVTIEKTGARSFRITFEATADNVGQYALTLLAEDNNGASTARQVLVTVADAKTRSVFVNLGEEGKTAKAPWNNWLGKRSAGEAINNLKDESGSVTTFSLSTVNGWSGTSVIGHLTGNNSGIAPDSVLESALADNGGSKQFLIGGLDPSKKYNVKFIGSQNEGLPAVAQYSTNTANTQLDARYNVNRSANLNGIVPNGSGEISVSITRAGGSAYTYLNGLIIEEYENSTPLLNPEHLYAEVIDRSRVQLTWNDRTGDEDASGGIELQRATDSLFQQSLSNVALPANTTQYEDQQLNADTKYWYRVRSKKGSSYSDFSNKFAVVTPASVVYVNFNSTLPDEPAPWNNTAASPLSEFILENLKNQSGANSGLSLMITKVFNGEFTAGANTGNNSGVVPDRVLASNFWLDNTQQSQIKLSGLDHTKKYRIGFVGSSSSPGWFKGNYTATYSVNNKTVFLNSWMNASKAVYISGIEPDASGEIYLDFSTTAIAQWAFNAGIIIHQYSDANGSSEIYMSNTVLDSADGLVSAPADLRLRMYPNPFRDEINLDYYNDAAGNRVSAEVYDIAGRLLLRRNFNELPQGNNTLRIRNSGQLKSGAVYMVVLRINGKVVHTQKLLRR